MTSRHKVFGISALMLAAVLGLAQRNQKTQAQSDLPKTNSSPVTSSIRLPKPSASKAQGFEKSHSLSFKALSSSPENDLQEIRKQAQSLREEDLQGLQKKSLDVQSQQDERFFALFLMSQNDSEKNLKFLVATVETPFNEHFQSADFERVLRAQALEAILNNESPKKEQALRHLSTKLQDRFLLDRLERTRYAIHHPDRSPEIQDREALRKLLGIKRTLRN